MKKLIVIIMTLGLLVMALGPAAVQGQGPSGSTWVSSFNVLNLDQSEDAQIVVSFYDTSASPVFSYALDPLGPEQSMEVYVPGIGGLPDGRYSIVLYSDKPVAALGTLGGDLAATHFVGSYSGAASEDADTTGYVPALLRNYYDWTSFLTVQNAGSNNTDITVDYYEDGSAVAVHQDTATSVPPGVSVDFDISDPAHGTALGSTFKGAAVVTSDEPVVVIDNQTTPNGQTQSYNAFTSGSTTVYIPDLYVDYYGWISSINIQNMGAVSTNVTVNYSDGETNYCTNLPAKSSCLLYQPGEAGHTSGTRFSATITSDTTDIVAIVNQAVPATNQAQSYLGKAGGTQRALMPKIMNSYYSWVTSFTVQNMGGGPTDITVTYSSYGATYPGTSYTIYSLAAGDSFQAYQPNDINCAAGEQPPVGYRGSVVVTSSAEPIIASVNETSLSPGGGDWSASTNAVNQ